MSQSRVDEQRGAVAPRARTPLNRMLALAALVVVAAFGLSGCGPVGTVKGTITDASGAPVAGLPVRLYADDTPTMVADTVTGESGTYTLKAPPGVYRLAVGDSTDPYADVWFGQALSWSTARSIDVTTGSGTADLTVVGATDAAAIGGLVTDSSTADPLGGIEVSLLGPGGATEATTSTDASGGYAFNALVPDVGYRVKFTDPSSVHATAFTSSARTPATAPVLTPMAGETLVADVSIPVAGAISGTVRDARQPLEGILVFVTLPHTTDRVALAVTDAQGGYALGGLAPDAYTVSFADPPWSPSGGVRPTAYHGQTVADLATAPDVVVTSGSTLDSVDGLMTGASCDPAVFHPGADLGGEQLSGLDLSACDLRDVEFAYANLTGTDLTGSNLSGAAFYGTDLTGADLSGADLTGAAYLSYATGLATTTLTGTDLTGVEALSGADLHGKDLTGTDFTGANLYGTNLSGATLTDAVLTGTTLTGANLSDAVGVNSTIVGTDQVAGLASAALGGVNFAGTGLDLSGLDLHGKEFAYANLSGANLSGSNLSGAAFYGTDLTGADLSGADLTGAAYLSYATGLATTTLTGTDLTGVEALSGADLHGKDLTGTDFTGANLYGTNLSGATLTDAVLTGTTLTGANLSDAVGVNSTIVGTDQVAGLASAALGGVNFAGTGLDLSGLDLHGKEFAYANLTGTDLTGSNLSGAAFYGTDLTGADLSGADLTGAAYLSYATRTGVVWSATATCPDGSLSGDDGDTCEGHL